MQIFPLKLDIYTPCESWITPPSLALLTGCPMNIDFDPSLVRWCPLPRSCIGWSHLFVCNILKSRAKLQQSDINLLKLTVCLLEHKHVTLLPNFLVDKTEQCKPQYSFRPYVKDILHVNHKPFLCCIREETIIVI